jgi:hypothetical protein
MKAILLLACATCAFGSPRESIAPQPISDATPT